MMAGRDFIMNDRDFHDDMSRFSWWQAEIVLWRVEIIMMKGRYFIINGNNYQGARTS